MLKALLRVRLTQTLNGLLGKTRKKSSAGRTVLFAVLMLYVFGCIVVMFVGMFSTIVVPFAEGGLAWLYFAFAAVMELAVTVFLGMFAAKARLYEARDNELLLSMPVPPRTILASRMLSVLADGYLTGLLVAGPAGVVWLRHYPADGGMIGCFLLLFLALPLLSFALSGAIGFVLARLTARVRKKTLVSTVTTLAFLALYFWVYSRFNVYLQSLAAGGESLAAALRGFAPLVWAGRACAEGNWLCLGGCLAVILAAFALVTALLGATFSRVVQAAGGSAGRARTRRWVLKQATPRGALLKKELGRLGSSSNYMINGGLGALFLLALPVVLLVKRSALLGIPMLQSLGSGLTACGAAVLICLILGTGSISAAALSLEGKSLWIPQSMPVRGRDVLLAKAWCQLVVMLPPAVLAAVLCAALLAPDAVTGVFLVLTAAAFAVFMALAGLWEGARHPVLDWLSEVQVIKQSTAVLLTMLIGWGAALLGGAGCLALGFYVHPAAGLAAFTLVLAAADGLLMRAVRRRGDKILAELS